MPRYTHDCVDCEFLGEWKEYDLYFCTQGGVRATVIGRYGNEGPDYSSGLFCADERMPELAEAKKRAQERGLL